MRNPHEVQMANLALQLLSRVSVQMTEIDAALAVRNWLTSVAQESPLTQMAAAAAAAHNGAEHPQAEGHG